MVCLALCLLHIEDGFICRAFAGRNQIQIEQNRSERRPDIVGQGCHDLAPFLFNPILFLDLLVQAFAHLVDAVCQGIEFIPPF